MGRIEKRKGAVTLIKAWKSIPKENRSGWTLVLMGPHGDDQEALYLLRQSDPTISWLGQVSEEQKRVVLSTSSVFVQPSNFESFGLTTIEAMHQGCAIIAAESGANPEIAENAIFFPPDSSDSLAKQISFLIERPKVVIELGQNMKARAQSLYSSKAFIERFESILEKL